MLISTAIAENQPLTFAHFPVENRLVGGIMAMFIWMAAWTVRLHRTLVAGLKQSLKFGALEPSTPNLKRGGLS
jgi:hypothetical protein